MGLIHCLIINFQMAKMKKRKITLVLENEESRRVTYKQPKLLNAIATNEVVQVPRVLLSHRFSKCTMHVWYF